MTVLTPHRGNEGKVQVGCEPWLIRTGRCGVKLKTFWKIKINIKVYAKCALTKYTFQVVCSRSCCHSAYYLSTSWISKLLLNWKSISSESLLDFWLAKLIALPISKSGFTSGDVKRKLSASSSMEFSCRKEIPIDARTKMTVGMIP